MLSVVDLALETLTGTLILLFLSFFVKHVNLLYGNMFTNGALGQ